MKITSLIEGYEEPKDVKIDKYKQQLDKLLENHEIDFLEYNYLLHFSTEHSVIIGTNKFIKIINKIKSNNNILIEIIVNNYPKLLTIKNDNVLAINKNNYKDATNLPNIELTKEQKKCVKKIIKFLIDDSRKTFGLYGFAGTGKTTTCVEVINYLLINKYIVKVVLATPTHKALNVIKSKFKPYLESIYKKLTGKKIETNNFDDILLRLNQVNVIIDFITIHKLLSFKNDYSTDGEMIFTRDNSSSKNSLIDTYDLVIIDECSMISLDMLDIIFETIRTTDKKIIFSGDPAQLPPVNEPHSFVFIKDKSELHIDEYIEHINRSDTEYVTSDIVEIMNNNRLQLINDILNMDSFLLQNVVRSKIDTVTNVCYEIRKWVENKTDMPQLYKYIDKKGVSFYKYNNSKKKKVKTNWFKKYVEYLGKNEHSIILTWTNKQSSTYNNKVRKKIFNKKKLEKFIVGDILILTDFYSLDSENEKLDSKFYTSDQIKVVDTDNVIYYIINFQFEPNKVLKKTKGFLTIEDKCKKFIRFINNYTYSNNNLKCWALCVKKICSEQSNKYNFIRVLDDSEIDRYRELKATLMGYISDFSNKMLFAYKEKERFIEENVIKPLWKQFHTIIVAPFAQVDYGYSITCHKSQGSNFYNVFVDIHDVLKNNNINEVKKCAYTAVTRTSNELFLLI